MVTENGNAATFFIDRHAEGERAHHVAFKESDGRERAIDYATLAKQTGRMAAL